MSLIYEVTTNQATRKITSNAFWSRVTEDKEIILRTMADDALASKDYTLSIRLRKIDNAEFVDLDDEKLRRGLDDLKNAGIFTPSEIDNIFADAMKIEIPEALK